jgi:hypothetical protein
MLDQDPDRAGMRYNRLQLKLLKYFEYNCCRDDPGELGDRTIRRVAALLESKPIPSQDIERFALAVARRIAHEWWRAIPLRLKALGGWDSHELRDHDCFEIASARLSEPERTLIEEYYPATIGEAPAQRKLLAERYGISDAALRKRVNEIVRKMKGFYEDCRDKKSP